MENYVKKKDGERPAYLEMRALIEGNADEHDLVNTVSIWAVARIVVKSGVLMTMGVEGVRRRLTADRNGVERFPVGIITYHQKSQS